MIDRDTATTDQQPQPSGAGGKQPGAIPYARFVAVNSAKKALEAKLAERRQQAALAEDLKAQIHGLQLQVHARDVAADMGLPHEMLPYIQGGSKREISDKAAGLLEALPHLRQQDAPPDFAPGQVADQDWYRRNRARVLRRFGLDG